MSLIMRSPADKSSSASLSEDNWSVKFGLEDVTMSKTEVNEEDSGIILKFKPSAYTTDSEGIHYQEGEYLIEISGQTYEGSFTSNEAINHFIPSDILDMGINPFKITLTASGTSSLMFEYDLIKEGNEAFNFIRRFIYSEERTSNDISLTPGSGLFLNKKGSGEFIVKFPTMHKGDVHKVFANADEKRVDKHYGRIVMSHRNNVLDDSSNILPVFSTLIKPSDYSKLRALYADPGLTPSYGARSARHLMALYPGIENGYYWIHVPYLGYAVEMYCDFEVNGGGWMRVDHELMSKYPELMEFHMPYVTGAHHHREWHNVELGQFEIGDDLDRIGASAWAATIHTPEFKETFGDMSVFGWGVHAPDDGANASYNDTNFWKGLGSSNTQGFVFGAHNEEVGRMLKPPGIWGNNFTGKRTFVYPYTELDFIADKFTHLTGDGAREVVRWVEYRYYIR